MNLDIDSLVETNELLKARLNRETRRARMREFGMKMIDTFRQASEKAIDEMGLRQEPDPIPVLSTYEEISARTKQHQEQHLNLLRSQTEALRRWRDSL